MANYSDIILHERWGISRGTFIGQHLLSLTQIIYTTLAHARTVLTCSTWLTKSGHNYRDGYKMISISYTHFHTHSSNAHKFVSLLTRCSIVRGPLIL